MSNKNIGGGREGLGRQLHVSQAFADPRERVSRLTLDVSQICLAEESLLETKPAQPGGDGYGLY